MEGLPALFWIRKIIELNETDLGYVHITLRQLGLVLYDYEAGLGHFRDVSAYYEISGLFAALVMVLDHNQPQLTRKVLWLVCQIFIGLEQFPHWIREMCYVTNFQAIAEAMMNGNDDQARTLAQRALEHIPAVKGFGH